MVCDKKIFLLFLILSISVKCSFGITNGSPGVARAFPSHAVFMSNVNGFYQVLCGGAIVSRSIIVTVAHCADYVKTFGIRNVQIHIGRQYVNYPVDQDLPDSKQYSIQGIINHPKYNPNNNDNDIALVKATSAMVLSGNVRAACISSNYVDTSIAVGSYLIAIGFGATEFGKQAESDPPSWILRYIQPQVIETQDCDRWRKICAQGDIIGNRRADTCERDSGSPIYAYIDGQQMLMALTSAGAHCGLLDTYSVNTGVPSHLQWIKTVVNNNRESVCEVRSF